jgi:hypothetical protein
LGFDAGDVMRELDGQRVMPEVDAHRLRHALDGQRALREASRGVAMDYDLLRRKMMPEVIRNERMLRSVQVSAARIAGDVRTAEMVRRSVSTPLANFNVRIAETVRRSVSAPLADFNLRAAEMVRRSVSAPLADFSSHVLRQTSTFAIRDLGYSIAQAFEAQDIASAYSEGWRLRVMPYTRTSALQSILRVTSTFGPIVVPPDYDYEAPFDYHPDLQGWRIPETATESGEAIDVEELWAAVVAWAQGIAVHHRTEVLST